MGQMINVHIGKFYFVNGIKNLLSGTKSGSIYPNSAEMSITDNIG